MVRDNIISKMVHAAIHFCCLSRKTVKPRTVSTIQFRRMDPQTATRLRGWNNWKSPWRTTHNGCSRWEFFSLKISHTNDCFFLWLYIMGKKYIHKNNYVWKLMMCWRNVHQSVVISSNYWTYSHACSPKQSIGFFDFFLCGLKIFQNKHASFPCNEMICGFMPLIQSLL